MDAGTVAAQVSPKLARPTAIRVHISMTPIGRSGPSPDLVDWLGCRDGVQAAEASSRHFVDYHGDKAVLLGIARY
jgi:hypothetical protein